MSLPVPRHRPFAITELQDLPASSCTHVGSLVFASPLTPLAARSVIGVDRKSSVAGGGGILGVGGAGASTVDASSESGTNLPRKTKRSFILKVALDAAT